MEGKPAKRERLIPKGKRLLWVAPDGSHHYGESPADMDEAKRAYKVLEELRNHINKLRADGHEINYRKDDPGQAA